MEELVNALRTKGAVETLFAVDGGADTRQAVADETGLPYSSVSRVAGKLVEEDLLKETTGGSTNGRGRAENDLNTTDTGAYLVESFRRAAEGDVPMKAVYR